MHVGELWRHPVKSLQGERLAEATVVADGLAGDRSWGIRDAATGLVLTGRREPRLLLGAARLVDGEPCIDLPDGTNHAGTGGAVDAALSAWLGHDVNLVAADAEPALDAEAFADATDDTSDAVSWTMPAGRFVDALPILLLTTASIRAGRALHPDGVWDVRRFRPNVFVDTPPGGAAANGWLEDGWVGSVVRAGEVELEPLAPCSRCTMVTRPQPGLDRDLDVYRTLARAHGATFGVWATVRTAGTIREGDEVEVRPAR